MADAAPPTGRIVLLGATGYTGGLAARALLRLGRRPVLAARSAPRLAALAAALAPGHGEVETAVADATDPASVARLVGRGDVLVTTVGPFARYGGAALDAAVGAGAAYVDSTGEPGFLRAVFEGRDDPARAAGATLLPAFGYDYVPGNLAAGLAVEAAPGDAEVTRLDVGYFVAAAGRAGLTSAISSGTAASMLLALNEPGYTFRGGRLVEEVPGRRHASLPVAGRPRGAIGVGATETLSLPRLYPGLTDVGVYFGWAGAATRAVQALSYVTPAPGSPGRLARAQARGRERLAERFVRRSGSGPDEAARAKVGVRVVAYAYDRKGRRVGRAELAGGNPYEFTAEILAWAAARAADGKVAGPGVLGPLEAFGLADLLDGVRAAGLRQVG